MKRVRYDYSLDTNNLVIIVLVGLIINLIVAAFDFISMNYTSVIKPSLDIYLENSPWVLL